MQFYCHFQDDWHYLKDFRWIPIRSALNRELNIELNRKLKIMVSFIYKKGNLFLTYEFLIISDIICYSYNICDLSHVYRIRLILHNLCLAFMFSTPNFYSRYIFGVYIECTLVYVTNELFSNIRPVKDQKWRIVNVAYDLLLPRHLNKN